MKDIPNMQTLRLTIKELEEKRIEQATDLKLQVHATLESLRPSTIVRNMINELLKAPELKTSLLKAGLLFLAGKVVPGAGMTRSLLRNVLSWGVAVSVTGNDDDHRFSMENLMNKAKGYVSGLFQKSSSVG